MKNIIFLFISLLLCTGLWAQTSTPPAGDGSLNNPYKIATLNNLYWLSQTSSAWGKYFVQTANINASATSSWAGGTGWTPIGNTTTQFTGTYNGQGYTISGLYINRYVSQDNQGFFGYANNATIKNLGLSNVNIAGNNNTGALAGYAFCIIEKCFVTGTVKGNRYIGGLVGSGGCYFINCYNSASIIGYIGVGGLIGYNTSSFIEIRNCYSNGAVAAGNYSGGLIGDGYSSVSNSFYDSETSGQSDTKGTPKTTLEMKDINTYLNASWDFANVWAISSSVNNGYPCFLSQISSSTAPVIGTLSFDAATFEASCTVTQIGSPLSYSYGFCYSTTNTTPTVDDDKFDLGGCGTAGEFKTTFTGLNSNTTYYVRAYITNAKTGTTYSSNVVQFTTPAVDIFDVTSSASSYCNTATGVDISLSGSTSGVNYQLYRNGIAVGAPQTGTGSELTWTNQLKGSYTVKALYSCVTITMSGSPFIVENNATISPTTSPSICSSTIHTLTADFNQVLFYENFSDGINKWTIKNNTANIAHELAQWKQFSNNGEYYSWNEPQFYMSDLNYSNVSNEESDLISQPINTTGGYTSLTLTFIHCFITQSSSTANVDVSTNDGNTWTTVQTFNTEQGVRTAFSYVSIDLSDYIGQSNLRLRFRHVCPTQGKEWAIDNIQITGRTEMPVWTPITGLYTDAGATTAYTENTPLNVVYANPAVATTYTASVNYGVCTLTKEVSIIDDKRPKLTVVDPSANSCSDVDITSSSVITENTNSGVLSYWQDASASISLNNPSSVAKSGTYYIKSINSCGYDIKSVNVSVYEKPLIESKAICPGNNQQLNAYFYDNKKVILNENFNTSIDDWTISAYFSLTPYSNAFVSDDRTQTCGFDLSKDGTTKEGYLESPVIDLSAAYSSATLSFWHHFTHSNSAMGAVQISVDNGATWNNLESYTTSQGLYNYFKNVSIDLSSYIGQANVKIRFYFKLNNTTCRWHIDNVKIEALQANDMPVVWSPATDLFTDEALTTAYDGVTATNKVYAKVTGEQTYTASYNYGSCSRSESITVKLPQAPVVTSNSGQYVCGDSWATLTSDVPATWLPAEELNLSGFPYTGGNTTTVYYHITSTKTFTVQSACNASTDYTITVDNSQPALSITNPAAACDAVDITTDAVITQNTNDGVLSYWKDASASASLTTPTTVTESGTYYIKSTNGCGSVIRSVEVQILDAPVITAQAVTGITSTTATGNGNITSLGGSSVTSYGVCWSATNTMPTISDNKTDKGSTSTTGAFAAAITGLEPNAKYYIRAYATNGTCCGYSDVVEFTTPCIQLTITDPTLVLSKTFDGTTNANITELGTVTGIVGTDDVTVDAQATYDNAEVATNKTITVHYTLSGTDAGKYTAPADYTITTGIITKSQLYVVGAGITTTKAYDGTKTAEVYFSGTLNGVAAVDASSISYSITATYASANASESAINISVQYSFTGVNTNNYILPGNYIVAGHINRKQLTITDPTITLSKVYDGNNTVAVTCGTLSGVVSGEDITVAATAVYDNADAVTGKTITVSYTLGGTSNTDNYYGPNQFSTTGEITAKTITVTAEAKTKVYGEADPSLTYTFSPALIGSDAFTGNLSRATGENIGNYAINQGTLSAGTNYNITFVGNSFAITAKAITVSANANQTKVYGEADPTLTYSVSPALIGSDAFTGNLSRTVGEIAGTYTIEQGTLALSSNYALSYVGNNFEITAKPITVTADTKTKVYGQSDPVLTYAFTPTLIGNDAFSGNLSRTVGEIAGTYTIEQGTLALSSNYALSYVGNTFEITKATPVITWNNPANITYGTALSATQLNATANVPGSFTYSPVAGTVLSAGEGQTLSVAFTPDDAVNYISVSKNVTINVAKAMLTVTATSHTIVVGEAIPTLTYSYSGFVNGEDESVLDVKPTATTNATATSPAGTYDINVSAGDDNNYAFSYVSGNLTITPSTGTLDIEKNNVLVYPNPTSGKLIVKSENLKVNRIDVINITGKVVISTSNVEIDLSNYPNGLYFIKIIADTKVYTEKIIKE